MMKRALALILALVLCLGVLAGCQNTEPDETTKAPENTTAAPDNNTTVPEDTTPEKPDTVKEFDGKEMTIWTTTDLNQGWLSKAVEHATGMKATYYRYSTDALTTALTDKVTPSLIFQTGYAGAQTYGRQGAFINLADYLDQMPNMKAAMELPENEDLVAKYWLTEDELYAAPVFLGGDVQRYVFFYRQDIMEELKLDYWTDFDSFYNVLKKMKAEYPDSYPLTFRSMDGTGMATLRELGYMWGDSHSFFGNSYTMSLDSETGKYYSGYTSDGMRQLLKDIKTLMDEELMHPSCLTFNTDGWIESITTGKSFITYDKCFQYDSLNKNLTEAIPTAKLGYGAPVVMREGGTAGSAQSTSGYCWSVTRRAADVDLAVAFLDWMYSEEGKLTTSWGIENETFKYNEDGSISYLETETFDDAARKEFARYQGAANIDFNATLAAYSEECGKCCLLGMEYGIVPADPRLTWNSAEQMDVDVYNKPYQDAGAANIQEFMKGDKDPTSDADWKAHLDEMAALNEAYLIQLAQKCYDEGRFT